jgi:hypothetical protein
VRRRSKRHTPASLDAIVAAYVIEWREDAKAELQFFASPPTFADALRLAALAEGPGGKRMAHQRRIPRTVLRHSATRLSARAKTLQRAKTFEELHDQVANVILPIRGIGELTVYDTALRIAVFRRLKPKRVYLHAGTRVGARALGVSGDREWVAPHELPMAFRRLRPREIEDCLCIYKAELGALAGGTPRKRIGSSRRAC